MLSEAMAAAISSSLTVVERVSGVGSDAALIELLKVCRSIKKVGPSLKLETLPVLRPRIPLFSLRQHADGDGKSLPQPPVGTLFATCPLQRSGFILSARSDRGPRFDDRDGIPNVLAATHNMRGLHNSRGHACNTADRRPRSRPHPGNHTPENHSLDKDLNLDIARNTSVHTRDSCHNSHQRNHLPRSPRLEVEAGE